MKAVHYLLKIILKLTVLNLANLSCCKVGNIVNNVVKILYYQTKS